MGLFDTVVRPPHLHSEVLRRPLRRCFLRSYGGVIASTGYEIDDVFIPKVTEVSYINKNLCHNQNWML